MSIVNINWIKVVAQIVAMLASLVVVTATTPTFAQSTFPIDPKATYLATTSDPQAVAATPISLSSIGVGPGQEIELSFTGSVAIGVGSSPVSPGVVLGLFSSDGTVAGALQANVRQVKTWPTYSGGVRTNIQQDFPIPPAPDTIVVTVPDRAAYVLFALADRFYSDNNSSTLAVTLTVVEHADLELGAYLTSAPLAGQSAVVEVPADSRATYRFTVLNNGPDAASGIKIEVPIPAAAVFDSGVFVDNEGGSGTCIAGPEMLTCALSQLDSGHTANATVSFRLSLTAKDVMRLTATVKSNAADPNRSNNRAVTPGIVAVTPKR